MILNEAEMLLATMTLSVYCQTPIALRDHIKPESTLGKSLVYLAIRGWTLTPDNCGSTKWKTGNQKEHPCVS